MERSGVLGDDGTAMASAVGAGIGPSWTQQTAFDEESAVGDFEESELYQTHQERMRGDNDFIYCIAPSSKTPGSGTGKTTHAIQAARAFAADDIGFDAEKHASLSSEEVADDLYPNLPPRSAIVFDEAQGTRQSHGTDARRHMADAVLNMIRAAAIYRWKQITLIIVTQSTRWIDNRMMEIIDRLLLIQELDYDRNYARGIIFDYYFDDLGSSSGEYTPAHEDIYWRPLDKSDADYQKLHEMKRKSGKTGPVESDDESDETEWSKDHKVELANYLYHEKGLTQEEIGDMPQIDQSQQWVSKNV